MTNREYWQKRVKAEEEEYFLQTKKEIDKQYKLYKSSMKIIQDIINNYIVKFAQENNMDLITANQILNKKELKEFYWSLEEYEKYATQVYNDQLLKQVKNASIRTRITRLEALQKQIELELLKLSNKQIISLEKHLENSYIDGYYKNAYHSNMMGFESYIQELDENYIKRIVNIPWVYDKINFKTRLGKTNMQTLQEIKKSLFIAHTTGQSVYTMVENLSKKFDKAFYKVARLIQTEATAVREKATMDSYIETGVEKYQFIAALDEKTCHICGSLDKKIILLNNRHQGINYPPMHPNCRCTTVPYYEDEDSEEKRTSRNEQGKNIEIKNISYDEWKEKYVVEKEKKLTYKESSAIIRYIGGGSYAFNERIRQNLTTNEDKKEMMVLDKALEKLPNYKGVVYRTLHIFNKENLEKFLFEHKLKKKVVYPAYTSTSINTGYNDDANINLTIISKTGKDISKFNYNEAEVLFKRDSKFKVIDRYKGNRTYYFLMEEILDE